VGGIRISKSFLEIETLGQNVVLHECALNSILRAGVYQNLDWRNQILSTNPRRNTGLKTLSLGGGLGQWENEFGRED